MMKRIAILGECMIELNGEPFGTMKQTFGGDSLNTALYLVRAANGTAIDVQYVTVMGVDPLSRETIARWQQAGIETSMVLTDRLRQPGLYLIQLDERGERTFLYWRTESAARYLMQHPNIEKVKQALAEVDAIYLSGISLAILPAQDRDKLLKLLGTLRLAGKQIIFDSNYRPTLWESPDTARETYRQLLPIISLALVTDDDEQNLWGDLDVVGTLARLRDAGVSEAVIKTGAAGCIYQHLQQGTSPIVIPAQTVVEVVDTTSAGDSFNAGFLAGYLSKMAPEECARMGHQLAGVVIQHRGAIVPESETRIVTDLFKLEKHL